jgi:hypothetical protein
MAGSRPCSKWRKWFIVYLPYADEARRLHLAYGGRMFMTDTLDDLDVCAVLCAVGCLRLAFLLTDLDPRDPLDEEMASWKLWLVRVVKRAERVANSIEVIARWADGELDAETARELLSRRVVRLRESWKGFLVPTFYLHKLDGDELAEVREKARAQPLARWRWFVDAMSLMGESVSVAMLEPPYLEERA